MSDAPHQDAWGDRWIRLLWRKPPETLGERTRRRVTVHVIPFLFFLYILAYLDRVNISVAGRGMELPPEKGGLGFTADIFGFGAGLFFWGYWILEIPSTISVARWGARWVFVRILILWGVCAAMCGLIALPFMQNLFGWLPTLDSGEVWLLGDVGNYISKLATEPKYQFYFFRFMLGFFEGGFFPTVIVYLTYWYTAQDRAKAIACFMVAIPFSSAVGLPFSSWLMKHVEWLNLEGWRWVLIIEGILPVAAGIATLFLLPNRPRDVAWLAPEERDWLQAELDAEQRRKQGHASHFAWVHHLGAVVLLTMVYFGQNVSSYGLSMFMPAILQSQTGASDDATGWITGGYYLLAAIAMLVNGWHSDRTKERIWHVCISLLVQGVALYLAAAFDSVQWVPFIIFMCFVSLTHYAHLPAFWPIPTMFLGALAAASAIGFINMVGNLGGYFGPNMVGKAVTEDIGWLKKVMETDERDSKLLPDGDAAPLRDAIMKTTSTAEARKLRQDWAATEPKEYADRLERIAKLEANLDQGGKLTSEETLQVARNLTAAARRIAMSKEETGTTIWLLGRGASFASGLKKLFYWPILAAGIILAVGFVRKRYGPVQA